MEKMYLDGAGVYLDFALTNGSQVGILSVFDRSLTVVKAFGALLNTSHSAFRIKGRNGESRLFSGRNASFQTFVQPVIYGKEKFYHAICLNKYLREHMLLLTQGKQGEQFYDYLMTNFDLPLLKEWGEPLLDYFIRLEKVDTNSFLFQGEGSDDRSLTLGKCEISIRELTLAAVSVTEDDLRNAVSHLLSERVICISKKPQKKLEFKDMDSYFREYGHTLVENLSRSIKPLRELDGEVHDFTLRTKRLYPQQIAQINGDVAQLERANAVILNHGMGTGKTLCGGSICESFFVRKWLRSNPKRTLADAYQEGDTIKYRNIIMCPGHLVGATCYRT